MPLHKLNSEKLQVIHHHIIDDNTIKIPVIKSATQSTNPNRILCKNMHANNLHMSCSLWKN